MKPVSKELSRERLLAIAAHLEKPQKELHHEYFNFTVVRELSHSCGSSGCAIGEAPVIFPDHFEYTDRWVQAKGGSAANLGFSFQEFLGIDWDHMNTLFMPKSFASFKTKALTQAGIYHLPKSATKEEVAANIRQYVNHFLS